MKNYYINSIPNIIKESSKGYDILPINDSLLQKREVFLVDRVDTKTMNDTIKQILYLSRENPYEEITLYIGSPGGECSAGLCIFDFLKLIKTPIRTVCIGTCASMGAILFCAGDKREILPHSQIMIHDPSHGGGSLAGLKPGELEEKVKDLRKIQNITCSIIAETTGHSIESVMDKTKTDTYFNAEEALAFGLATHIISSL